MCIYKGMSVRICETGACVGVPMCGLCMYKRARMCGACDVCGACVCMCGVCVCACVVCTCARIGVWCVHM